MPRYTGCRVVVGFEDGRPALEDDDSDLHLEEGALLLTYWDDQGAVVYEGRERAPDRFELVARSRPRTGTLQREDPHTFAGSWSERGETGTLRVELPVSRSSNPPEASDPSGRPPDEEPR